MLSCILALVCGAIIILIDQLSKYFIATNLILGEVHGFIGGLLNIVFVENRGAAWGMFSGKTIILLLISLIAMAICVVFLIKAGSKNKLLFWSLSIVIAGGIGNMIDRFFRKGVVVDFLQFDFWQSFPVFNIADCAIVIGGALMILYILLDILKDTNKNTGKKAKQENDEDN